MEWLLKLFYFQFSYFSKMDEMAKKKKVSDEN